MAVLKRIANKHGDGAGRAPYALEKAVAVRTDIPSYLSLLLGPGELPAELKRELAREFNRHLLIHQGNCRTQHFVISFGHHLTQRQVEKLLDRIEAIFSDPFRYHLYAVHQEDHGTAVHVIESADPDGKLRHLSQKEFYDLKRTVIRELHPFMNAREREVARNFRKGTPTQDWKHQVELHAPERSFKEYVRQAVLKASELIRQGNIEGAIEFLTSKGIEITEKKAGELSPFGRILKRDRMYAVANHPKYGLIAVRLDKKMRATFRLYLNALEELERELREAEEALREDREAHRGAPGAGEQETAVREGTSGEGDRTSEGRFGPQPASERTPAPEKAETGASGRDTRASDETERAPEPAGGAGERDKQTQIPERPAGNRNNLIKEPDRESETGEKRPFERGIASSSAGKVSEETDNTPSPDYSPHGQSFDERTSLRDREKLQEEASEPEAELCGSTETACSLPSERSNSGSSEKLGNIHQRPSEQPLLPSHTEELPRPLQHKGQVEIPEEALRDVHTSESTSEAQSEVNRDYFMSFIPSVYRGEDWIVITDREEVLDILRAEEVALVRTPEEIAEYWEEIRREGVVKLYLSDLPDNWILEGVKRCVWKTPSGREVRPKKVSAGKYYDIDGELYLDVEIQESPESFIDCSNEKARAYARALLEKFKEQQEKEHYQDRSEDIDYDYDGPGF